MKPVTTIFEEKTLKMLEALSPARREMVLKAMRCIIHDAVADKLGAFMDCDDCPIAVYCAERRSSSCENIIYDYLEDDFTDDTNG